MANTRALVVAAVAVMCGAMDGTASTALPARILPRRALLDAPYWHPRAQQQDHQAGPCDTLNIRVRTHPLSAQLLP
jgi:hypothetical protein